MQASTRPSPGLVSAQNCFTSAAQALTKERDDDKDEKPQKATRSPSVRLGAHSRRDPNGRSTSGDSWGAIGRRISLRPQDLSLINAARLRPTLVGRRIGRQESLCKATTTLG